MITSEQFSSARILIADDQKLHSLFLEKILNQEGYRNIKYITNPLKILEGAREFHPDLIILDLIMPHLDGFQVMEQFTNFRKNHYLPILTLSEDHSSDVRLRALQSGATDFLSKPYENVEIFFRIRNMLEMRFLHMAVENQNKNLEATVSKRTKELRESQLDIIRRLAQAAEFRDNDTGIHIIRMSQYCVKFGEALGFNEIKCELLLNASPLHDVGKIGIPDSILLKPGRLTKEEFEIMKTHATIGAQLLSGSHSPVMRMAEVIALTHHEKWDGTGYPKQLKGESIPIVGRICSICDVFDALTSQRPYKEPWNTQQAVQEISKLKGTSFDPQLVERFMELLPKLVDIKAKNIE